LAVDPDSPSSVSHYRTLIQPEEQEDNSDEDDEDEEKEVKPLEPLENALKIALVDYAMVIRRCLTHFQRPAHQATRVDMQQRKFDTVIHVMENNSRY
jgi:dedicator of cytokinesis protein 3